MFEVVGRHDTAPVAPATGHTAHVPHVLPSSAQDKVISNLAEYGNTSAASIPLALDEAVRAGSVKQGDVVRPCPCILSCDGLVSRH